MNTVVSNQKITLKSLLPHKSFLILLTANLISRFGDSIDSIAYSWMIYVLTGSKLMMGTIFAVNVVPSLLFSIFSGVLIDHYSKKLIIILGDIGRGLIVCLTAFLFIHDALQPWHLYVLTFLTSTFEIFVRPSKSALIPHFLPNKLLMTANSFSTSAQSTAELIGLGTAGLIIATAGIGGALLIDGLTFFISCVLIFFMHSIPSNTSSNKLTPQVYIQNLKQGFSFIKSQYVILFCIIASPLINFFITPFNVLQPVYVEEILHAGPEGLSFLGTGFMVGMILGGLLLGQFGSEINGKRLLTIGILGFGFFYGLLSLPGYFSIPFISPLILGTIFCFMIGLTLPLINTPLNSYIMANTPKNMLGRVNSLLGMLSLSSIPLGATLTGVISEIVPIPPLFLSTGFLIMLCSFLFLFNKKLAF